MNGLELCREYYKEICRPAIKDSFPGDISKMAFGLVGDGSECYGFDDEISQDHDFGPRIMIWLTPENFDEFGEKLQKFVLNLPRKFSGYNGVNTSKYGEGREGVFTIPGFYKRFIGIDRLPATMKEWRALPETNLSIATNGEVFSDYPGEFSKFRNALLRGYPEELKLKMMAARCMKMAQSGQYNYARCLKRGEFVAAQMAASEFIDSTISLIYLVNNRYKPFYKWMHRGLRELPVLGHEISQSLSNLATSNFLEESVNIIESICGLVISKLQEMGFTDSPSDFLLDHGPSIQMKIKDEYLRNLPPWG